MIFYSTSYFYLLIPILRPTHIFLSFLEQGIKLVLFVCLDSTDRQVFTLSKIFR
jgi:hypothetical protein